MRQHLGRTLIPGPIEEGKESMHEAIRNPVITSRHDGTPAAPELPGEVFTRRVITVVLGLITALTFAFGFGNVWALGRALGVPAFVAPLVGPAVDLSVAGLLIGIRHLSMVGVPREQLRPARVLLTACGAATLALNIAGPVAAGAYGRAAFDSVGPALLIGWAETGPGLLRHLYAVRTRQLRPVPGHGEAPAASADAAAGDTVPIRTGLPESPAPRTVRPAGHTSAGQTGKTPSSRRRVSMTCSPKPDGSTASTASGTAAPSPRRRCARRCGSAPPVPGHWSSVSANCTNRSRARPQNPDPNRASGARRKPARTASARAGAARRQPRPVSSRRCRHDRPEATCAGVRPMRNDHQVHAQPHRPSR